MLLYVWKYYLMIVRNFITYWNFIKFYKYYKIVRKIVKQYQSVNLVSQLIINYILCKVNLTSCCSFNFFLFYFPFSPIEQAQHRGTRLRHSNSLSFSGSRSSRKATSSLSELRLESDLKVCHFLFYVIINVMNSILHIIC